MEILRIRVNRRLDSLQICIATVVVGVSFIVASLLASVDSFRNFVVGIR